MQQVFNGLRVLDFGRYIAAPLVGALFADLGADVIRIEKREGGEDRWVQTVGENGAGTSFLSSNRNKRSMTLDTTTPEGREVVARLVATADIVLANMPDAAMRANGLDYDTLKAIKPDIILASATAFGRGGPYSDRVGFDGIGQVISGATYRTGPPEQPYKTAVPYVDYVTGLSLTIGAMAAVIHRNATGEGQEVEAALLPAALLVSNALLIDEAINKKDFPRVGNKGMAIGPADLFEVEGGFYLVQITGQGMFKRWCRMVDRLEWFDDPRFAEDELRAQNIDPLNERMAEWCRGKSIEDVTAELEKARLPGSPVLSPRQVLRDPHIEAMGYLKPVEYPGVSGPVPIIETPFRLSATPGTIRMRPPLLGEHTDAVLDEIGYAADEIAGLRERNVI